MDFDFHPEAAEELRRAVQFYEAETAGLGLEFAIETRRAIEHLLEYPLSGSPGEAGTRRKLLPRFPYNIIYLIDESLLHVIAVMHQRQKPGFWRDRV